jgi:hypothetical protein
MLPNKFLAFESHPLCGICGEAVTIPICPSCLMTEIEAWMTLYPNLRKELVPKLRRYVGNTKEAINGISCIKCKNKKASICPYCFTEYVLFELKKIGSSKLILKEFLDFFNFDFYHYGYSKEAEELGVI